MAQSMHPAGMPLKVFTECHHVLTISVLQACCAVTTEYAGLALADRHFVISERISQMTKGNITAFVNLTKALKRLIYSKSKLIAFKMPLF